LYEANQLGYLVTDDYLFRYYTRKQNNLPIDLIITSYSAVFWLIMYKIFKKQFCQVNKDKALSKKAAKVANKYDYDLIAYSYYGLPAFDILNPNLKKILFQLHPQPNFIKKLFEEEIKLIPASEKSLSQEHELKNNDNHFHQLNLEAKSADLVLCASSFTKYTLEQENINTKIEVIPYGVDLKDYPFFDKDINSKTLKVLFVGSLNQRKGIYYLLEAIEKMQNDKFDIELTIVGRGIFDKEILSLFKINRLNIKQNVSFAELINFYKDSDVFVLPSICEGFAQVILEAMATGLPVISTNHTSAPDLLNDGTDGFVIPIRDSKIIVDKLTYLIKNPIERQIMGKLAFEKSKLFNWERFKKQLIQRLNAK
ncbi:MAG: glycosyltransferase family 4 protein, partial [Flavobacteriales bacterium]|nr:glycosyltransferase family 4 protein [Flavobacteriales bacterium]